MIEWRDQGVVLATRRHGENAAIAEIFTHHHGRCAGVVRGGAGRKMAPVLQPGAQVDVIWRARLADHLGHFTVEPVRSRMAQVMSDRAALTGLNAVCAMLAYALPDREPHPRLFARTVPLLDLLGQGDVWLLAYAQWEVLLLEELGYGLDLSTCAVMGARANDLSFISPRTGRAVSRAGAGEWADRLLPFSPALIGADSTDADVQTALRVTGHFLALHLPPALSRPLPEARARLLD